MVKKLQWESDLSVDLNTIWEFFSNPENLNRLTPDEVEFRIDFISYPGNMYPGMMVKYKIAPFPLKWISFTWVAEIKQVKSQLYFIDEQRFGPFAFWYHEHRFEQLPNDKVKIIDLLVYKLPFGFVGRLVDQLIIGKFINRIFSERKKLLEKIFNSHV
jgi:ligand-binding SRPBCC domain-containing protein